MFASFKPRTAPALDSYTAAQAAGAKAAVDLSEVGHQKAADKLLRQHGLKMADAQAYVDSLIAETAPEPEPFYGTETPEPPQGGVERRVVGVPPTYRDSLNERARLIAALWREFGEDWQVESFDQRNGTVVAVRGELPSMRPAAEVYAAPSATTGNGAAIAEAHAAEGRTMVGFNPYRREAETAILPPATMQLREQMLRKNPKQNSWDLELLPIFDVRDGQGFLSRVIITRADLHFPGDHDKEVAYWLGVARTAIGDEGWRVEVNAKTGRIDMIHGMPRKLPARVPMLDMLPEALDAGGWSDLPLGVDPERKTTSIDLRLGPHSVLVGPTGSGKSVAMRQMMTSALSRGHQVLLVDVIKEGADFMSIKPWCSAWGETIQDAADIIVTAYKEGVRRKKIVKQYGVGFWEDLPEDVKRRENICPVLLVIDEFVSLILLESIPKTLDKESAIFKESTRINELKALIVMYAGKIARESRFVGIHLAVAMQRPDAALMGGGEFRSNLTSAIQLVKPGKQPSRDALGMVFAGDELISVTETLSELDDGRSRGLGVMSSDGGEVVGFRVAFTDADEIPGLLEAMGVPYPKPWAIESAVPEEDDGSYASAPQPAWAATPAVVDLGEMEFSLDDLDEAADPAAAAPAWAAATEAVPNADDEAQEDEWAPTQAVPTPRAEPAEDDPFADSAAVPASRIVTAADDDDPFAAPAAPPKKKVAAPIADAFWDD